MPRISDVFLQSIIYLYESEKDAVEGEEIGATGFLLGIPYKYRDHVVTHVYAVTNAHVVEEMRNKITSTNKKCIAIRINRVNDKPYVVQTQSSNWEFHPNGDDIAVSYLYIDSQIRRGLSWKLISRDLLITQNMIKTYNIGVGTDVYIIGRFRNYPGKNFNKPTVRIGHIALMADESEDEKISQNHLRPINHKQESFVLNCRSDHGFSGSPIFVELYSSVDGIKLLLNLYDDKLMKMVRSAEHMAAAMVSFPNQPDIIPKTLEARAKVYQDYNENVDRVSTQLTPFLLGVNWGHYPATRKTKSRQDEVEDNTDFSCTVPAWKLAELLDKSSLVNERELMEEKFRKEIDLFVQGDEPVADEGS